MNNKNFEELLKELEVTVAELEKKDVALDDAIKMYQKGLELSKACYDKLESAQKLIVKEVEN